MFMASLKEAAINVFYLMCIVIPCEACVDKASTDVDCRSFAHKTMVKWHTSMSTYLENKHFFQQFFLLKNVLNGSQRALRKCYLKFQGLGLAFCRKKD